MADKSHWKNYSINLLGMFVPLIISLVTVPVYVAHIGEARYGLLSIVWVLLGYFGFLDLGLSHASANALSKTARPAERAAILATALRVNAIMGFCGGAVLWMFGYAMLTQMLKIPSELVPEIKSALPWVAFLIPLAMMNGVAVGSLESRNKFLEANVVQMIGTIGGQIPPVICAVAFSPSLAYVVPIAICCRALAVIGSVIYVLKLERAPGSFVFDKTIARSLLGYGGWVSVSGLIGPLLNSLDQIVLGSTLGVALVAYYAVSINLVLRTQIVATALARTLFPSLSRATPAEAVLLGVRAGGALSVMYCALCAPALLLIEPFLRLWMGNDFGAVAGPVARVLLVGAWLNGVAYIPYSLLQAQGKPRVTALLHAAEVIPFLAALWFLTKHFGLVGAAAAWSLRVGADVILLAVASRMAGRFFVYLGLAFLAMIGTLALAEVLVVSVYLRLAIAALIGFSTLVTCFLCISELRTFAGTLFRGFRKWRFEVGARGQ